ncbi:MAG: PH domain-containing protein [Actinomycetota bacterium]|nr:PH domain-containing protein [Actinomycetota bacterium]
MRLERIRKRYMADGEREVLSTRRHLAAVLVPFLVTIAVGWAASAIGAASSPRNGGDSLDTVLGWVVLAFVVRFLFKLLEWWYDVIFVTDRRIFEVRGLVPQHVYSMPLWKVTDMTYRRTFWGFLLGYGALTLETAGQNQALDHMNYLPDPEGFYKAVNSQGSTFESPGGAGEGEQAPEEGDSSAPERYNTPPFPFRLG